MVSGLRYVETDTHCILIHSYLIIKFVKRNENKYCPASMSVTLAFPLRSNPIAHSYKLSSQIVAIAQTLATPTLLPLLSANNMSPAAAATAYRQL